MTQKLDPTALAENFARQMGKAYGPDLQALFLVGSAARGDFVPGRSDVNTLVILSDQGMDNLEKAHPLLKAEQRHNVAVPHFMTAASLRRSLDSYPLEILDFKTFHRTLQGQDLLAELEIPSQPLRLQIEREARGKLLLLRRAFVAEASREKELMEVLRRSLSAFTAIFQGILALQKQPIPAERKKLFEDAASIAAFSSSVFQRIAELRAGKGPKLPSGQARALFKELLSEVSKIVAWVDSYQIG